MREVTYLSPQQTRDLNLTSICACAESCVMFTACTACRQHQFQYTHSPNLCILNTTQNDVNKLKINVRDMNMRKTKK